MQFQFLATDRVYDGSQLSSHFALRTAGIAGDSLIAFQGAMDIPPDKIADLEDLRAGETIRGARLVHFIAEHFGVNLEMGVMRQRLLVRLAADLVNQRTAEKVVVDGDDLYVNDGKLSVSIAAPSPVSCLIHLGLNVTTDQVPVKAASLDELGVDAVAFASDLGHAYVGELASIRGALSKVRGVP